MPFRLASMPCVVAYICALMSAPARADFVVQPDSVPSEAQFAAATRALPPGERGELFSSGEADLNGDYLPDLIGQFGYLCAQGRCDGFVLLATESGFAPRTIPLPAFVGKVTVLDTVHRGMRDLRFDDAGYIWRWDGRAYR